MIERSLPAGPHHVVRARFSGRADGDFRVDGPAAALAERRSRMAAGSWTWLRQVHGGRVVRVDGPGDRAGDEADGAVTTVPGAVMSVQTADCAPVVLAGPGVCGVVHAGWRGVVAGVLGGAVEEIRRVGSGEVRALLGPCIHPAGYEFGPADIDRVAAVVGESARGVTADGRPALDLPATIRAALAAAGVADFDDLGIDTAQDGWFSHRIRRDRGRQTTAAWLEESR